MKTKKHAPAAAPAPPARRHTLAVSMPGARSVVVTGSFCDWSPEGRPMRHLGNGTWEATLSLPPGRHEYRLLVDGGWHDDPNCGERVPNGLGGENCVLQV